MGFGKWDLGSGIWEVVARYADVNIIIQKIVGLDCIEMSTTKIEIALATKIEQLDEVIIIGYSPTVATATILAK